MRLGGEEIGWRASLEERLSHRLEEASQRIAERHDQFERSDVTEVDSKSNEG